MGKSDPHVFSWYSRELARLPNRSYERVCVLGARGHNRFTQSIDCRQFDFFDLCLGNWNINDDVWTAPAASYDLVICTRCSYFAEDPRQFIEKCLELLKPGGIAFLDWGLGDHWRILPYKVGWRSPNQLQESVTYGDAGGHESLLWSCFWNDDLELKAEAIDFLRNVKRMPGYDDDRTLSEIIRAEVPNITSSPVPRDISLLSLWPDSPQLYVLTVFDK